LRFSEFLRITVLLSAAAASALGVLTIAAAAGTGNDLVGLIAAGWWLIASSIGSWMGRRAAASTPIASLLSNARMQSSLPELHPARTVVNRLWPLFVCTLGAGALALAGPQVPAIAAGFAIIWSLAWRRQSQAVVAIEERDGARFYIEPTSPLARIRLVRTPGFRTDLREYSGSSRPGRVRPRT
jgi:hypothetical protein